MDRHSSSGFSLIELLITLAIIAILASITIPSYSGFIEKSRRGDAITALLQIQMLQERWRVDHPQYAAGLAAMGWTRAATDGNYYRLRVQQASAGNYLAVAVPDGVQRFDACGIFAVDFRGPVYASSYASPRCWRR